MDFFKSQFDRIQEQISALSSSQKMLTGTLIAIMVMTLAFWGHFAGTADMEPLLNQSFSQEELALITARLVDKHIEYKVVGDKIMIPADRKIEVLADLSYNNMLPKVTASGFDDIIKQSNPFDSTSRETAVFNHGKEVTLSRIISEWPGVASASVIIDPRSERHIGADIEPVATVNIRMKQGSNGGKQLARAAASIVAGSQAGLAVGRVKVLIDSRHIVVHDDADGGPDVADSFREIVQAEELRLTQKVETHLNIPGALVSVAVTVNNKASTVKETTVDEKKSLHVEADIESGVQDHSNSAPGAIEGGAVPNVGASIAAAPPAGETTTSNETKDHTRFLNVPAVREENTSAPAGQTTVVAASVRVPRSYFVGLAKQMAGDAKEPDASTVKKLIAEEIPSIREAVMKTLFLQKSSDISVDAYADLLAPAAAAPAQASSVTLAVGGHLKEIVLGGMALMSLFMVSMMVKKGTPATITLPPAPAPSAGSPILGTGDTLVGEAIAGGTTLDGMELDDEAVRAQQVLDQVSTLITENPDAAANLVKRWLNRG